MKTLAIITLAAALSSCTTTSTTTTANQPSHRDLSEKRVHTQAELQKTGRSETGDALQEVDPAVTISRGR